MDKNEITAAAVKLMMGAPMTHHHMGRLADLLGVERSQFQRLFKERLGITPARFQQFLMSQKALAHLRMDKAILAASMEAGFSSTSRLHDAMITWEAMSPGHIRHGGKDLLVTYGLAHGLLGQMMLAWTDLGLCFVGFAQGHDQGLQDLKQRYPEACYQRDDAHAAVLLHESGFMTGVPPACRLHLLGSQFQLQVWRALLHVAPGFWSTYGDLAKILGKPKASRAVGGAVGANPLAVLVPCHRIMAADGQWNGYHWGLGIKKALVAIEAGAQSSDNTSFME